MLAENIDTFSSLQTIGSPELPTTSKELTLIDTESSGDGGISTGAVIGIVVACFIALLATAFGGRYYFLNLRRRPEETREEETRQTPEISSIRAPTLRADVVAVPQFDEHATTSE